MAKTPVSAKKQRSISAFFTPRLSAKPEVPPPVEKSPSDEPSATRKRLSEFQHASNGDLTKPPSPKRAKPTSKASSKATEKAPALKASKTKLTPLEKQFVELKLANPDKVLAIQVGYKFKFFGNDAVIALQLLNIMLIRGNLELDERTHDRFAYCSVPDNRLHIHLQRLLNHGMKVGVVKQTEIAAIKSAESKLGLFERKITGVYTKATYMGDEMLTGDPSINRSNQVDESADGNSYIMAVNDADPKNTAIVAVQPVTGDIIYDVFADNSAKDELETRLAYLMPSEVLIISAASSVSHDASKLIKLRNPAASVQFRAQKKQLQVQADLESFFSSIDTDGKVSHLTEFYQLNYHAAVCSCINELVNYLAEFQLSNIFTIPSNMSSFTDSRKYMLLPANTLRALDIFEIEDNPSARKGTLLWLLNHTKTKNGSRLLQKWISRPLVIKSEIEERLNAVQTLRDGRFVHMLDVLKSTIQKIGKENIDLDRLLIKVHYSAEYMNDKIARRDVYLMLRGFSDILEVFQKFGEKGLAEFKAANVSPYLQSLFEKMSDLSKEPHVGDLLGLINSAAAMDVNNLSDQKMKFFNLNHEKFDSILLEQEQIAMTESELDEELRSIRSYLKRPQLQYVTNLKDTHLIEVRNGKSVDALPSDWLKISGTKSVSRFRPPEVARLHKELSYHQDKLLRACDECFNKFLKEIDSHYEYLHNIVSHASVFDCLLSLASVGADDQEYTKPKIVDEQVIDIKEGNHPILYALAQNTTYVPNDVDISHDQNRVMIITGPNMGGKSSYVKQVALSVIMAQIGAFIPCKSATLGVFDSVFIRMGASDNILRGKSTFMVEMAESANIINSFSSKSLVILDEIGRGTGTSDGIALAYSILRYMIESDDKPLTLFITHYPSLHVLENEFDNVKNFHMSFVETHRGQDKDWPEVVFLYKLVQGVISNSYGLNVAKLAGIPLDVIKDAHARSESMKREVELHNLMHALGNIGGQDAAQALQTLVHLL